MTMSRTPKRLSDGLVTPGVVATAAILCGCYGGADAPSPEDTDRATTTGGESPSAWRGSGGRCPSASP